MNTIKIAKYVIDNYPKSCFYANYNDKHLDKFDEEELIQDLSNFFKYDVLKICGCGSPEDVSELIRKILLHYRVDKYLKENEELNMGLNIYTAILKILNLNKDNETHELVFQYIIYMLNDARLLEHGSSIYNSWITELGEMFIYVFNRC